MRRPPKLVARQAAFLSTLNLLFDEIDGSDPRVRAAIVSASAALVVGADLDDQPYVPQTGYGLGCDDCGRTDGTHDPEVEH